MGILKSIQGMFDWAAGVRNFNDVRFIDWKMPPAKLLSGDSASGFDAVLHPLALEMELEKFGFPCRVGEPQAGPSSTLYEVKPTGITSIKVLDKILPDVGLRLGLFGIQSKGALPGKQAIGVEIERGSTPTIQLAAMASSMEDHAIPVPIGVQPNGKALSIDLAKAPHLLVAGSTGTGKSVFINSLISSSLLLRDPDQVQFVLIDPKMVEFNRYAGIPHLLMNVITEVDSAVYALSVMERFMDDRFKEISKVGCSNITEYNSYLARGNSSEPFLNRVVIIIDEFADLIMQNKNVEQPVVRIAQKARAAGIHLVIGTQRPVVKVVTGLIKANVPARVSFRVPSSIDSRVVLDEKGAEHLGGPGDLLVKGPGIFKATRAQAPYVDTDLVERLVAHWRPQDAFLNRYN
ncbi:MAG: hypothetical protein CMA70_04865 [Euryarchaeota archaeon]|nr:hypothetical protein [Euryarchaeota archaeon]